MRTTAALLISGGDFCFAEPPGTRKAIDDRQDRTSFQFADQRKRPKPIRNKALRVVTAFCEMLRNALKRFGMLC
jgi:hypothetical protein